MTEARATDGGELGLEQFAGYIIRATATGEPASAGRLRDEATILMFEWSGPPG
ncbi:hypothetical protein [Streptomyces afghaniensis]|uniref:hypothetical protein n=1 Tax=Streptomyces afghaniensis TaxID=66865 RepID=UPI0027D7959D|nr:hypothetical protein [Streptomyces afghaniensis]